MDKTKPDLQIRCVIQNYFSYFSTKTYVVGAQKNGLNELDWIPKAHVKTDR